jgi:hypothetical protein
LILPTPYLADTAISSGGGSKRCATPSLLPATRHDQSPPRAGDMHGKRQDGF